MGEQIRNGHPGREKKQVIIKKKHRVKFRERNRHCLRVKSYQNKMIATNI
jgi:hypothetical protein